jgi:hypothetical protein
MAEAQRCAEQVAWPESLAELALAKAELARWRGDADQARAELDVATGIIGVGADSVRHDLLGYLSEDLGEARKHRASAVEAAAAAGLAPLTAQVIVGLADLALRQEQYEQAARLLAASAAVRGLPDRSQPDVARIEQETRRRLGDTRFTEATREGAQASWRDLAAVTLAG